MKHFCLNLMMVLLSTSAFSQADSNEAKRLLDIQAKCWNNGDLYGFMDTYWKSDSLLFIGKNGVARGWDRTLSNYQKKYPDTVAMGKLSFDILEQKKLSAELYFLIGKYTLKRTADTVSGIFSLLIQKKNDKWVIIADHTP